MPIDVQMPDGTIVQGVPEGTTQAQLQAMLARRAAPAAPPQPQDLTNEAGISGAQESPDLQAQEQALVAPNERLIGAAAQLAPVGRLAGIGLGAAGGAIQPANSLGERAENAAIGAGGALAGIGLGKILSAGRSLLDSEYQGAVNFLKSRGFLLSAAQQTGRAIPAPEQYGTAQSIQLTKAALAQMGLPGAARADEATMLLGKKALQANYNALGEQVTVPMTPALDAALTQAQEEAEAKLGNETDVNTIKKFIARIRSGGDQIDGTKFLNLKQELTDMDPAGGKAPIIRQLRGAMTDAFAAASTPEQRALLAKTDQQWGAMKIIEGGIGPQNRIEPDKLWNSYDTKANSSQAIFGQGSNTDLGELARTSKLILGSGGKEIDAGRQGISSPFANYVAHRVLAHAALGGGVGGLAGYEAGGRRGALVGGTAGLAMAAFGPAVATAVMRNPQANAAFAAWATKNGIRTVQDAAAYAARAGGGAAGAAFGPSTTSE